MKDLHQLSQQELIQIIENKDKKISTMEEQLSWYKNQIKLQQKALFGKRSEKSVTDTQLSLFDEAEVEASAIKTEPALETVVYQRKKKNKKRTIDLSKLPVTRKVYEIENPVCPTCGDSPRKIGEETRKELVYHPATYEVIEPVQYVYACRSCEVKDTKTTILKAASPKAVLPKSIASASLLANIINDKYNKALPLYRQEVSFKEQGLLLSRQTMANWMMKLYDRYLKSMVSYMHTKVLEMEYICADETTVQVLREAGKAASSKSYMWVYKSGRSEEKQMVIYQYEPSRKHEHVVKYLQGYTGILQSDGYQAYEKVEGATHMGCWAHARRKYVEAVEVIPKGTDKKNTQSYHLLEKINKLFDLERECEGKTYEEIYAYRNKYVKPLVEDYFKEVEELLKYSVGKSPLDTALQYSHNQESKLKKYLEDGRIEMSNNSCERAVKPFTIGRKNWLFMNSVNGASSSAAIYSIVESAKINGLVPIKYIEYLLTQLVDMDMDKQEIIESVLPWSKTLPKEVYQTKKS